MDFLATHAHPYLLLVGLALFPRITSALMILVGGLASGGILWWLGWIFTPHLLVAFLSLPYWHSNPALVIIAWFFALCGTGGEAETARRKILR
jgi:uncharacterized membrane protein YGL010W